MKHVLSMILAFIVAQNTYLIAGVFFKGYEYRLIASLLLIPLPVVVFFRSSFFLMKSMAPKSKEPHHIALDYSKLEDSQVFKKVNLSKK